MYVRLWKYLDVFNLFEIKQTSTTAYIGKVGNASRFILHRFGAESVKHSCLKCALHRKVEPVG